MRGLGHLLRKWALPELEPRFEAREPGSSSGSLSVTRILDHQAFHQMIEKSEFPKVFMELKLPYKRDTVISLGFKDEVNSVYPISGFPRCLHNDGTQEQGGGYISVPRKIHSADTVPRNSRKAWVLMEFAHDRSESMNE